MPPNCPDPHLQAAPHPPPPPVWTATVIQKAKKNIWLKNTSHVNLLSLNHMCKIGLSKDTIWN